MKKTDILLLEIGNDIKKKFESGEQLLYTDYVTEENKVLFDSLLENIYSPTNQFEAAVATFKNNTDRETLLYITIFIAHLSVINRDYMYLTDGIKYFPEVFKQIHSLSSETENIFNEAKKTKHIEPLLQHLEKNPFSLFFLLKIISNNKTTNKLSELDQIDTENKLEYFRTKIDNCLNERTIQL